DSENEAFHLCQCSVQRLLPTFSQGLASTQMKCFILGIARQGWSLDSLWPPLRKASLLLVRRSKGIARTIGRYQLRLGALASRLLPVLLPAPEIKSPITLMDRV